MIELIQKQKVVVSLPKSCGELVWNDFRKDWGVTLPSFLSEPETKHPTFPAK